MRQKEKNCRKLCLLLASSLFLYLAPPTEAYAKQAQTIYSYTTKSMITAPDSQISYMYNGIEINLAGMPAIVTNNSVALGPYVPIFQDKLGIDTSYNKSKKTLTLKKDDTTLVLTLGSKTAKLNGKTVQMSAAPISVKYTSTGKTSLLVPTRFVAETFGYYYEWNNQTDTASITKALRLIYDNQTVTYKGILGSVSFDGKKINVSDMPTIIFGNTAMVQAYRVFYTNLGVDYKYDKNKNQLIFKKGDITLEMQLDSSIAYINGQVVDCGMAPKLVMNQESDYESVLVPGQFVTKALGYNYTWNSIRKVSEITTSDMVGIKPNIILSSSSKSKPSGSKGSPTQNKGNILKPLQYFNWKSTTEAKTVIQDAKNALGQSKSLESSNIEATNLTEIKEAPMVDESETIQLKLSNPYNKVSASQEGATITLLLENTYGNTVQYDYVKELLKSAQVVSDATTMTTKVILTTTQENANYKLVSSEDATSIYVTIYPNYLTDVIAGQDASGSPYFTFSGLTALQPIITEDDLNVYVQLTNTKNSIGDMEYSADTSEKKLLDFVILESPTDKSAFFVIKKPANNATYELKQDGLNSTIYFKQTENIPVYDNTAIQVLLPQGVTADMISDEDRYYNRQILLYLPGDYRNFYEENPISNTYDSVTNIKVSYNLDNQTVLTVTTNRIQGYQYTVENNVLSLTVDQPSKFYDKIVVLDAGHGGYDPGASPNGVKEKNINFSVLNVYAKEYFKDSGIKVYYTRVDDTLIPLADRAGFAQETEADLFISVHCNAAASSKASGTDVYYSTINKARGITGLTSKALASSLVNSLSASLGTKNRGTVDRGFVVVRDNSVPAVLIELGFLTNSAECDKLVSPAYQKKAAQTIYNTVVDIFDAYPTKR